MALSLQFVLVLVYLCPCVAVEVSKACYGSEPTCTSHTLRCSSGVIAIQEAFFTNSKVCGTGVSNCDNISLSSIPLTGRRYNFSDTDLNSLYRNCATQFTCSHRAERRATFYFSAIIYQCTNDTSEANYSDTKTSISTHATTAQNTQKLPSTDFATGAIAGGVVGVLVVCGIVSAVLVWFKFVRNKKEDKKRERESTNNAYGASLPTTATEYGGNRKTTSNYDYATVHNGDNPVGP